MSRVPGTYAQPRRVRTLLVVPSPNTPGLTAAERLALMLRRDANIAGRCVCGATFPRVRYRHGGVLHAVMTHASDCPAADEPTLSRMVDRLGAALEYEAVVVDLEVAA